MEKVPSTAKLKPRHKSSSEPMRKVAHGLQNLVGRQAAKACVTSAAAGETEKGKEVSLAPKTETSPAMPEARWESP